MTDGLTTSFSSPVGEFYFTEEGTARRLPFAVRKRQVDDYELYNENNEIIGSIPAENVYTLCVDCSTLQKGRIYCLCFSGEEFHCFGSGEHCFEYTGSHGRYSFGVGVVEFNDDLIWALSDEQYHSLDMYAPCRRNCPDFHAWYTHNEFRGNENFPDERFCFELFGDEFRQVEFYVAWTDAPLAENVREEAIDFWVMW